MKSDIFHKKPIESDKTPVEPDRNYSDPTESDPPSLTWMSAHGRDRLYTIVASLRNGIATFGT